MVEYVFVFFICFIGSMIQGAVGFGYAMFGMALLPLIMPYKTATVIVLLSGFVMLNQILFKIGRNVNLKMMLFPTLFSFVGSTIGVYILMHYPEQFLRIILGFLLVILSLYCLYIQKKVSIAPSIRNGIITGIISGISGGVSNIDGPPLVVYYFSAASNKLEYNATLQATFLAGGLFTTFIHIWYGNVTGDVIRLALFAALGVILGSITGLRIFSKLNYKILSKLIYIFMMIMGVMLIVK